MARSPHESSFSFSRRHFKWPVLGKSSSHGASNAGEDDFIKAEDDEEATMAFSSTCPSFHSEDFVSPPPCKPLKQQQQQQPQQQRRKGRTAVSRLRTALAAALAGRHRQVGLGARLTGTLYGAPPRPRPPRVPGGPARVPRAAPGAGRAHGVAGARDGLGPRAHRARVRSAAKGGGACAFPTAAAAPSSSSSSSSSSSAGGRKLVEETVWRAYCNGRSCGYAVRRECGAADWRVLRALEPVSMGAGVIPAACGGGEGDVMYMRARFERVVGSRDSEAFYMMNPDCGGSGSNNNGGPELSVYLLRV
ncbi:hypothetical protein OsJ_02790 [Oryza sativa Japonica Group]|uniref:Uncharacterized protein n=1 Tax=Oryza sativa subsp. japonica TaxID=39947 RepID=A2ZVX2_ORYSJ|nr:hypothetical protein OsJ_02790 [Oryza sativa Japonica Group]